MQGDFKKWWLMGNGVKGQVPKRERNGPLPQLRVTQTHWIYPIFAEGDLSGCLAFPKQWEHLERD